MTYKAIAEKVFCELSDGYFDFDAEDIKTIQDALVKVAIKARRDAIEEIIILFLDYDYDVAYNKAKKLSKDLK